MEVTRCYFQCVHHRTEPARKLGLLDILRHPACHRSRNWWKENVIGVVPLFESKISVSHFPFPTILGRIPVSKWWLCAQRISGHLFNTCIINHNYIHLSLSLSLSLSLALYVYCEHPKICAICQVVLPSGAITFHFILCW